MKEEDGGLGEYKLTLTSAGGVAVFGLLAAVTGCFIYKYKCKKPPNLLEIVQDEYSSTVIPHSSPYLRENQVLQSWQCDAYFDSALSRPSDDA